MNLYKTRKKEFQCLDERGCLTQLVHEGFCQVNVLESENGVRRGAHFHKRSLEAFYIVSGRVEVELWNEMERETIVFSQGDFFEIYPFVFHEMRFLDKTIMVQLYDRPVDSDGELDIYRDGG